MRTGKFAANDARHLDMRAALSKKYGPRELWNVLDHWPLYVGKANLARYIANYELLKIVIPDLKNNAFRKRIEGVVFDCEKEILPLPARRRFPKLTMRFSILSGSFFTFNGDLLVWPM